MEDLRKCRISDAANQAKCPDLVDGYTPVSIYEGLSGNHDCESFACNFFFISDYLVDVSWKTV